MSQDQLSSGATEEPIYAPWRRAYVLVQEYTLELEELFEATPFWQAICARVMTHPVPLPQIPKLHLGGKGLFQHEGEPCLHVSQMMVIPPKSEAGQPEILEFTIVAHLADDTTEFFPVQVPFETLIEGTIPEALAAITLAGEPYFIPGSHPTEADLNSPLQEALTDA